MSEPSGNHQKVEFDFYAHSQANKKGQCQCLPPRQAKRKGGSDESSVRAFVARFTSLSDEKPSDPEPTHSNRATGGHQAAAAAPPQGVAQNASRPLSSTDTGEPFYAKHSGLVYQHSNYSSRQNSLNTLSSRHQLPKRLLFHFDPEIG